MRDCTAFSLQGILICYFGSFPVWETVLPVLFKEFLFVILDLSLYERLYCVFSSRNSYLLFWIFAGMRDCTGCSLQGILICYFGSFPVWETVLPVLFKEFLIAIVDLSLYERLYCVFSSRNSYLLFFYLSLYERLYCLFSSRNSYLLFWIFRCMRDCTACSLQGILSSYFGSFAVWETVLRNVFKEFLFSISDLCRYERLYSLFSSRNSYLLFWIFPCMRDETASSLQGFLICYFGSFPVLEMKLPLLFKDFLFAILDLSLYERWNCFFSSRISYLLFWIFPYMRDENAYSLEGFLICYFGSFPVWETVLLVLIKEFWFAILDLSLYERLCCLFSSRNSYLLFCIFPCMRDETAFSLQGFLICYFGSFPVRETVLPVLFKEFWFAILDISGMRDCTAYSLQGILICYFGSLPVWETVQPVPLKEFLFAILDLSLYERLYCLFSSRNSYLLFWIFPCMRDETASSLQGFLICYFGSFIVWEMKLPLLFKDFLFAILNLSLYERWNCFFSSRISYLLFWIFPYMRDEDAYSLEGFLICYFGSFPIWETVLLVLIKEFLFAILDLSLYERLCWLFSSRNSYLLFWIFPCMRDETDFYLQGFLICYFGSFPVRETVLPVLFKEFLFAILDLSLYERLYCLFSTRNSYLIFWIFPCMRDCTACSLQGILICYFGSFPVWETVLRILLKEFLFAISDLCRYERLYCLFSSRNSYLLFWIFPCMRDCTTCSLQGILNCYCGSFPVWETGLRILFKEFLLAIFISFPVWETVLPFLFN